jgi:hypothetical protein
MRYLEFLPEALGNANEVVTAALDTLPVSIKQFASDNTSDILDSIGVAEEYADLQEYMRLRDAAYKKDDYKTAEQLFDRKIEPLYIKITDAIDQAPYSKDITEELVHVLELDLQEITRDYIEKYYGKIEPITEPGVDRKGMSFSQAFAEKNLYWAEHIIVQLKTDAVTAGGEPKTGGGNFSKSATQDKVTSKTGSNIKWGDEFAVLINIYVDENDIWAAIIGEFSNQFKEYVVGEYEDQELTKKLIKPIVVTFLHEVVHFEQEIRARANTKDKNYTGISVLPNTDIKRPQATSWDPTRPKGSPGQNTKYPKYRAGRRGNYPDIDSSNDPKVWAEYLGHTIEIEAHAAHVAAEMYSDIVTDRFGYKNRKMPQDDINYSIDNRIDNVRWNIFPPNWYQTAIADKAKSALSDPNRSNEDKRFIKVWNTFRKKLIQHLQSYKRELPPDTSIDDWIKSLS